MNENKPAETGEPTNAHPDAVYSPEVFDAMHSALNEANGSPTHALRVLISRSIAERPSVTEAEAIVAAVDAIRNPFATSTRQDELTVFEAAEKYAALRSAAVQS